MPRPPFRGFRIYQLESRGRLRLPVEMESFVPWFKEGASAVLIPTPVRTLSMFSTEAVGDWVNADFQVRPEDLGSEAAAIARFRTMTWEVQIKDGRRITLPEEARQLGLVPNSGQIAVATYGGCIELGHKEAFLAQAEQTARRLEELLAVTELES